MRVVNYKRDIVMSCGACYNVIEGRTSNIFRKVYNMTLNFAENFKRLRKEKGVTQEKIAEVLGVSSQSISRWELSVCYPDLELLPSIANYFGVTVDVLLSNDENAKKEDFELFKKTVYKLSNDSTERIGFVIEYCRKYPENPFFDYHLMWAIRDYADGESQKMAKYMPQMVKSAQRLIDDGRYREFAVQMMASVCEESELEKWLDMSPYTNSSRRYCLVARAMYRNESKMVHVQHGLEMLETIADRLDSRCPDALGTKKKTEFQRSVLRTVKSFGEGDDIPDGWKMFYAYKQLVLAACLFGQQEIEEGWKQFDSAIEKCKLVVSLEEEWLDLGGALFSNLRVSKDWKKAIDEEGEQHELFGVSRLSFYANRMSFIFDLLTSSRWAWFNSVRETPKYKAAVEWITKTREEMTP